MSSNSSDTSLPDEKIKTPKHMPTAAQENVLKRSYAASPSFADVASALLWTPEIVSCSPLETPSPALPPQEIIQAALRKLRVTLLPERQCQSLQGDSQEPTLGLYCPIEGADYVTDETVKELARQTGSDVVVVDAAHLAAGRCGRLAKMGGPLTFKSPTNPLHFTQPYPSKKRVENPPSPQATPRWGRKGTAPAVVSPWGNDGMNERTHLPAYETESDEASDTGSDVELPPRGSCHCISCLPQNVDYFEDIVNVKYNNSTCSDTVLRRPRLIYIRDVHSISMLPNAWYPHLLAAVRNRRRDINPESNAQIRGRERERVVPRAHSHSRSRSWSPNMWRPKPTSWMGRRSRSPQKELLIGDSQLSPSSIDVKQDGPKTVEASTQTGDLLENDLDLSRHSPVVSPSHTDDDLSAVGDELTLSPSTSTKSSAAEVKTDKTLDHAPTSLAPSSIAEEFSAATVLVHSSSSDLDTSPRKGGAEILTSPPTSPSRTPTRPSPPPHSERVINPTTIIFGISPLISRPPNKDDPKTIAYQEAELQDRLHKWRRGNSRLYYDLPKLSSTFPRNGSGFFRMETLVPRKRQVEMERKSRIQRLVELNELVLRMAIADAGGVLETMWSETNIYSPFPSEDKQNMSVTNKEFADPLVSEMYKQWEAKVLPWSAMTWVAQTAMENITDSTVSGDVQGTFKSDPSHLPVQVSWSAIARAWSNLGAKKSLRKLRKTWVKEFANSEAVDIGAETAADGNGEDLVKKLKEDQNLDEYEQQLLGCIIDRADMTTSFDQVHLPESTLDAVQTMVSLPLLHPEAFSYGILKEHSMSGCLLFGPPGTGKTLIARALATEAKCNMMSVMASDVLGKWWSESEKLVHSLFSIARRLSPCIVFIDEIDSLFAARSSSNDGSCGTHRMVITQFMQEIDGLKTLRKHNVVIIGATNRPFDLDDAILRRFPRRLLIDLPGEKEREAILKILLRDEKLAPTVSLGLLAKQTPKFSGSDLKHLCVSAVLVAVKESIKLPWDHTAPLQQATATTSNAPPTITSSPTTARIIQPHHFSKALLEVVPSSSETHSSVAALREWNNKFGEGKGDAKTTMPSASTTTSSNGRTYLYPYRGGQSSTGDASIGAYAPSSARTNSSYQHSPLAAGHSSLATRSEFTQTRPSGESLLTDPQNAYKL